MIGTKPVHLALALALIVLLSASCGAVSPTPTRTPITGTLTGRILTADGKPLIDIQKQTGIVMLVCNSSNKPGTCLSEDDLDLDVSVLIDSICRLGDTTGNCLLHWLLNAARLEEDGSYSIPFALPGQYDLLLVIMDRFVVGSGWAVQIRFVNVDPIEAGETTEYSPSMAPQSAVEEAAHATMIPEESTPTSTPESTAAHSPTSAPASASATA